MRRILVTAVALGPLLIASGAMAETVISNERTTPIATATANNNAADDVRIASGGSVRVATGAAITLNSNNTVVTEGGIRMDPPPPERPASWFRVETPARCASPTASTSSTT